MSGYEPLEDMAAHSSLSARELFHTEIASSALARDAPEPRRQSDRGREVC